MRICVIFDCNPVFIKCILWSDNSENEFSKTISKKLCWRRNGSSSNIPLQVLVRDQLKSNICFHQRVETIGLNKWWYERIDIFQANNDNNPFSKDPRLSHRIIPARKMKSLKSAAVFSSFLFLVANGKNGNSLLGLLSGIPWLMYSASSFSSLLITYFFFHVARWTNVNRIERKKKRSKYKMQILLYVDVFKILVRENFQFILSISLCLSLVCRLLFQTFFHTLLIIVIILYSLDNIPHLIYGLYNWKGDAHRAKDLIIMCSDTEIIYILRKSSNFNYSHLNLYIPFLVFGHDMEWWRVKRPKPELISEVIW